MSGKVAYSKSAHQKLAATKAKLAGVNAKLANAVNSGAMVNNQQLETARRAIDVSLAIAEVRLDQLRKSGERDWEAVKIEVESAWEVLSQSIRRLISVLSEGNVDLQIKDTLDTDS